MRPSRIHIAALAGLIVIAGAAAWIVIARGHNNLSHAAGETAVASQMAIGDIETASSSSRTVPDGSREYRSDRYHFSLIVPDDLDVNEYAEGGGAATITFQNPAKAEGFQAFILPYAGSQVSQARFKEDEPSGVRDDPKGIAIDGATGASFYSTNPALGETAEIWFIHDGYLYEVTTLKPLSSWLASIMTSWKFIPESEKE